MDKLGNNPTYSDDIKGSYYYQEMRTRDFLPFCTDIPVDNNFIPFYFYNYQWKNFNIPN
jgi:hypothetical protein